MAENVSRADIQPVLSLGLPIPGVSTVPDDALRYRDVLALWLRWNQTYERVTELMFSQGSEAAQLESLMDQVDALRNEAISRSRDLLD